MAKKLMEILNEKIPDLDETRPSPTLMQILDGLPEPTKRTHQPPDIAPATPHGDKPTTRQPSPRKPSGYSW
jgi:hypothetical protein